MTTLPQRNLQKFARALSGSGSPSIAQYVRGSLPHFHAYSYPRICSQQTRNLSSQFYKIQETASPKDSKQSIVGEVIDHSIDLKSVRPGDVIDVPYEMTISHSLRDFWQSAFYSHDRINTSTPFARSLNIQDQVIPFGLMLFLAGSMSHADQAKLQTGFKNAKYLWPAFAGDTLKKKFIIRSLRSTSDGQNSIFTIDCEVTNQRGIVVFTCEKTMLFPFIVPPSEVVVDTSTPNMAFLEHLIEQAETLQAIGSQTLTSLRPGQLIIHTLTRPLSETHSMQLASLARLTHERHFNTRRYKSEELLIPGGLVFGLTSSISSRDLHEILYEELLECSFPNNTAPGDTVGALTFINSREEHVGGDIEALSVRTLGIKNLDVQRVLAGTELPMKLFTDAHTRPGALEELLKKSCPELSKRIVCKADRKIYRLTPKQVPFLL